MKIKKEHLILIFIFLSGLIFRVIVYRNEVLIQSDTPYFSRLGKNLIEYGKYVFGENYNVGLFFPPGYPLFVGIMNLFINDLFISAKLVSLSASLITIFLFYLIGKRLYGNEAGLFAAFVYALHPLILKFSVYGATEALFFFFLFLSIYLFIVLVNRDDFFIYTLLGISIAMSYLTRPEGLLLLLLPFIYLFSSNPLKNKGRLLKTSFMLLIFILIISPYVLFLKNSTGKFALTGKIDHIAFLGEMSGGREFSKIMANPQDPSAKIGYLLNDEKTQLRAFERKTNFISYIFKDPFSLIGRYQKNVLQEIKFLIKLLMPIMLPLFFVFFRKDLFNKRIRLIFILFPVLYFAIYPLFVIMERHMLLIVLFLMLFSSGGFVNSTPIFFNLLDFYEMKKNKFTMLLGKNIKFIIILVFILTGLSYYKFSVFGKIPIPVEHVKAGYFLKNSVSSEYEKINVMSVRNWVSFYSDSRFTMLPFANSNDVINFAKLYNVDYIVISERYLGAWDYYDELLQMGKHSDEVELIYEDSSEKVIKLFKVIY